MWICKKTCQKCGQWKRFMNVFKSMGKNCSWKSKHRIKVKKDYIIAVSPIRFFSDLKLWQVTLSLYDKSSSFESSKLYLFTFNLKNSIAIILISVRTSWKVPICYINGNLMIPNRSPLYVALHGIPSKLKVQRSRFYYW